jgi:hypothetical protein
MTHRLYGSLAQTLAIKHQVLAVYRLTLAITQMLMPAVFLKRVVEYFNGAGILLGVQVGLMRGLPQTT